MPIATDRLSKLQILKLIQAVNEKDHDKIVKLIDNGIPDLVNFAEPSHGRTGLHLAACANDDATIKHLISYGADCDQTDLEGRTPYMKAAEYGHVQALKALLEGALDPDLSLRDLDGNNICNYCLHATKRHQECLNLAIKYGANVHVCDNDGSSLLSKATSEGLDKGVKTLLNAGVEVNQQNESTGKSALHIACEKGLEECARLLLKFNANPNCYNFKNVSAAHSASANGHLSVLQILSGYGADFNVLDAKRNTPMHLAADKGYGAVCKYLGQRGCLATAKNADGKLARVIAKDNEHKEALKECKKAEKNKGTKPGTQVEVVKFYDWMIENKTQLEVDVHDYDTETEGQRSGKIPTQDFISVLRANKSPLNEDKLQSILKPHDPQQSGKIDYELFFTAKKFINKQFLLDGGKKKKGGGSAKGKGKKGKTKIEMPICVKEEIERQKSGGPLLNYVEKKELLTDFTRFNKDNPPLHPIQDDSVWYCPKSGARFIHINEVIKYNDRESMKAAVKDGLDLDQKDKFYKTPLMMACLEGNLQMARYLVSHGANVNEMDSFKWTALHFACHSGQKDLVELLINNGAQMDTQSINGGTPIMRAIESSKCDVVQFMIDNGAKIQLENKKGSTALDIAFAYADPRIIEIVQKRWDQLPPPIDKRKKGGKASPKKRTRSAKTTSSTNRVSMPEIRLTKSQQNMKYEDHRETSAVIKAATAIANGASLDKDISYTPKRAWLPEPTTKELLGERQDNRERYGYEVDFVDYQPPFQSHITEMVSKIDITS